MRPRGPPWLQARQGDWDGLRDRAAASDQDPKWFTLLMVHLLISRGQDEEAE
jgi:hypothetical protein